MSHFCLLVITETKPTEGDLAQLLAPWDENDGVEGAKWDWFQIGGRWSGELNPDYDPQTDPQNIETCFCCGGTGKRNDALGQKARREDPTYTCNGCQGKGTSVKWPTDWRTDAPGNQCQVKDLPANTPLTPFALLRDGKWYERGDMGWFAAVANEKPQEKWAEEVGNLTSNLPPETWLTIVDCHI